MSLAVALPQVRGGRRRRVRCTWLARGRFHHDKERYLYAPRQVGPRLARLYAAGVRARAHRLGQPRLRARRAEEPAIAAGAARPMARRGVAGLVRRPPQPGLVHPGRTMPRAISGTGRTMPPCTASRVRRRSAITPVPVHRRRRCRAGSRRTCRAAASPRLDLPNRHLEYALTWYGLALTLIGVYRSLRPRPPAHSWSLGAQPIARSGARRHVMH